MPIRFYIILVLFAAAAVILTWFSIKREKDPALASNLTPIFVRFVFFLVAGIAILMMTIWLIY